MLTFLTGLAAGSLHVVSGPDHLAALAPMAVRDRARAARTGAAWGLGHGAGVVALGTLGLFARELVDVSWLASWSEFLVGFVLLVVGAWALRRAASLTVHSHDHGHDHDDHQHAHVHVGDAPHDTTAHEGHTHAAFGVGMLHGAAGTGHLFGVLPALALSREQAVIYLAAYLVAAVASMAAFGGALGAIAHRGGPRMIRGLMVACGVAAIGVGGFWLVTGFPAA
jgi:hypothetical protein